MSRGEFLTGAPMSKLESCMLPLQPWFLANDVNEIHCNSPCEIWIERIGGPWERQDVPELKEKCLQEIAVHFAASTLCSDSGSPFLLGSLPNGDRVQLVLPPVSETVVFAIRRHSIRRGIALADYLTDKTIVSQAPMIPVKAERLAVDVELRELLDSGRFAQFLSLAIRHKIIAVSGDSGTGKTMLLGALAQELPRNVRIISVSRDGELKVPQVNHLAMRADHVGKRNVSDLIEHAHKARPDWFLFDGVMGSDAHAVLWRSNRPGTIFTVKSAAAHSTIPTLAAMIHENSWNHLSIGDVEKYVRSHVDVVVHLGFPTRSGPKVSEILFYPE